MYATPADYKKKVVVLNGTINGYRYFYDPAHPLALQSGTVYVHRHVASVKIGRWLTRGEAAHHVNGDRSDNTVENIDVIPIDEHFRLHAKERGWRIREKRTCPSCGILFMQKDGRQKFCSVQCSAFSLRRVERPSKLELEQEVGRLSWLALGRKYGVSDNAVRKWARAYGIIE